MLSLHNHPLLMQHSPTHPLFIVINKSLATTFIFPRLAKEIKKLLWFPEHKESLSSIVASVDILRGDTSYRCFHERVAT